MKGSGTRFAFLSHLLCPETPSYGDRERFFISRTSDVASGDIATNSRIDTSVHIGSHVDLPAHFYACGQTVESFPASFWVFNRVLLISVSPKGKVLYHEVTEALTPHEGVDCELLLIKTGMGDLRQEQVYWRENVGLDPGLHGFLRERFPSVRAIGFDSISVSSFTDRPTGRQAHLRFLDPADPVLLLEDLDLRGVDDETSFLRITVAPLRISNCEALPCTVIGEIRD